MRRILIAITLTLPLSTPIQSLLDPLCAFLSRVAGSETPTKEGAGADPYGLHGEEGGGADPNGLAPQPPPSEAGGGADPYG